MQFLLRKVQVPACDIPLDRRRQARLGPASSRFPGTPGNYWSKAAAAWHHFAAVFQGELFSVAPLVKSYEAWRATVVM
jgi:hypothetical protein